MLKKIIRISTFTILVLALAAAWLLFGSGSNFSEDKKSFYIKTGSHYSNVEKDLNEQGIIKHIRLFTVLAKAIGYTENVKPGKYVIEKGSSIYDVLRLLKSGKQTAVKLIITKLRTKEDLAAKISSNFECDSSDVIHFLNSPDSLTDFGLDTNNVMLMVLPDTYLLSWTTPISKLFKRLNSEKHKFWNTERLKKAAQLGISSSQVYILASIVEEETNKQSDKGKIASVYLNRLKTGMKLGADPTVKFALKDFGLKRIYFKQLAVVSPFNTYQNKGLPPGPICTPSKNTIDAVLDAPATNYLYFVAKPELDGYSNFASNYKEHQQFAKAYQDALNILMKQKSGE